MIIAIIIIIIIYSEICQQGDYLSQMLDDALFLYYFYLDNDESEPAIILCGFISL
jgi:hypothetical protein